MSVKTESPKTESPKTEPVQTEPVESTPQPEAQADAPSQETNYSSRSLYFSSLPQNWAHISAISHVFGSLVGDPSLCSKVLSELSIRILGAKNGTVSGTACSPQILGVYEIGPFMLSIPLTKYMCIWISL
ncbi:hypothetical protein KIPB_012172 [Kipferlia bialata]|uniref:Uncharacterized protein n=1 Tax=Kipferlia bialata TaxID=797122 RepID=A0A391NV31_9EUKA|nr:hypothetical protein KIPB_012172 [Kipferlia bialata]|eukprot:g12172.t1